MIHYVAREKKSESDVERRFLRRRVGAALACAGREGLKARLLFHMDNFWV